MLKHPARAFWIVAVCTFVLDQVTKSIVRALWDARSALLPLDGIVSSFVKPAFGPYESVPLIGHVLLLTHVRNTGAAFGLLPGYQPIFITTSVIVLIVVAGYWRKVRPRVWPVVVALGLIAAGAFGNLIDRAVLGKVTDFVNVSVVDFPVFNVADSAIVVGVGILIVWLLFAPEDSHGPDGVVDGDGPVQVASEPDENGTREGGVA